MQEESSQNKTFSQLGRRRRSSEFLCLKKTYGITEVFDTYERNLIFYIRFLRRYMENPSTEPLSSAKGVLRYIKGILNLVLKYKREIIFHLKTTVIVTMEEIWKTKRAP